MKKIAVFLLTVFLAFTLLANAVFVSAAFEPIQIINGTNGAKSVFTNGGAANWTVSEVLTATPAVNPAPATSNNRFVIVGFPLSGISNNIAQGGVITSATVRLYLTTTWAKSTSMVTLYHLAHDTWLEDTSADNKPQSILPDASVVPITNDVFSVPTSLPDGNPVAFEFDITQALKKELEDPSDTQISMEVNYRASSMGSYIFASTRHTNVDLQPTLIIEYEEDTDPNDKIIWKNGRLYSGEMEPVGLINIEADLSSSAWGQAVNPYAKFFSDDISTSILPYLQTGDGRLSFQLSVISQAPQETIYIRWTEPTGRPQLVFNFNDGTTEKVAATHSAHVRGGNNSNSFVPTSSGNFYISGSPITYSSSYIGYLKFSVPSSITSKLDIVDTIQFEITPYGSNIPAAASGAEVTDDTKPAGQAVKYDTLVGVCLLEDNDWDHESITMNTRPRFSPDNLSLGNPVAGDNKLSITVKNTYSTAKSMKIVMAVYSGGNKLEKLFTEDIVDLESKQEKNISKIFTLADGAEAYSIKVFAWDNLANIIPLNEYFER